MAEKWWLWDVRVSEKEAKRRLSCEENPGFLGIAGMLFMRVKDPDYIFKMIDKETFCRSWPLIKTRIRTDSWFSHMADYWQPVYEKTLEELKEKGIKIHEFPNISINWNTYRLARNIRKLREKKRYSQKDMARWLNVKQQYVSKLETGRVNPSLETLGWIANFFIVDIVTLFDPIIREPLVKRALGSEAKEPQTPAV